MTSYSKNDTALKTSFLKFADDLGQLVLREHQILQDEMNQVRTLVGDAVKNLDSNFRQLDNETSAHMEFLDKILSDIKLDELQHKKISEINNQIKSHNASTIRVLQFDDIVQQLAGHTCTRIESMQELFVRLAESLSEIRQIDSSDKGGIKHCIDQMQTEVKSFCEILEKENPVKQRSMKEGKIELF